MFPKIQQRLVILFAAVIGGLVWLTVVGPLRAEDGSPGLSLFFARSTPMLAMVLAVVAGIPALALAVATAVRGNPLSGVFAWAGALCFLAATGGNIEGWVHRSTNLPGDYGYLIGELFVWFAVLIVCLAGIQKLRAPLRNRFALLRYDAHLGSDMKIAIPDSTSMMSGLICAVVGGVGCFFLLRDFDTGQVMWSLGLAFAIGGLVAHLCVPNNNPVPILVSPILVAVAGYAWVIKDHNTANAFREAWNSGELPGMALALPIHYASAAVAGGALGIGWGQALMGPKKNKATEAEQPKATDDAKQAS